MDCNYIHIYPHCALLASPLFSIYTPFFPETSLKQMAFSLATPIISQQLLTKVMVSCMFML